jgi:hypothetical protein
MEATDDAITRRPQPIPAPNWVGFLQAKHYHLKTT